MKKILALCLTAVLSFSLFAGCSDAELGYMSLMEDIMEAKAYEGESYVTIELGDAFKDVVGFDDITMDMDFVIDNSSTYMAGDIEMAFGDEALSEPVKFIMDRNNMYLSKSYYVEVMKLTSTYATEADKQMMDAYIAQVEEALAPYEYISVMDDEMMAEIYGGNSIFSNPASLVNVNKEIYEAMFSYLKTTYTDFTSGLIKKSGSSYTLEIDADSGVSFLKDLMTYVYENKEEVYDDTVPFIVEMYDVIEAESMSEESLSAEEFETQLLAAKDLMLLQIDEYYEVIMTSFDEESVKEFLGDSYIKSRVTETDEGYKDNVTMKLELDLSDMTDMLTYFLPADTIAEMKKGPVELFSMTVNTEYTTLSRVDDKVRVEDEDVVSMLEVMDLLSTSMPLSASSIQIIWDSTSENYADINITSVDGSNSFEVMEYYMSDDDRIYLPMRQISELFGEEVVWDAENQKAGIVRGDETIDMTGMLYKDLTYIKIRDFEKLGYTIDYVAENGINVATITK